MGISDKIKNSYFVTSLKVGKYTKRRGNGPALDPTTQVEYKKELEEQRREQEYHWQYQQRQQYEAGPSRPAEPADLDLARRQIAQYGRPERPPMQKSHSDSSFEFSRSANRQSQSQSQSQAAPPRTPDAQVRSSLYREPVQVVVGDLIDLSDEPSPSPAASSPALYSARPISFSGEGFYSSPTTGSPRNSFAQPEDLAVRSGYSSNVEDTGYGPYRFYDRDSSPQRHNSYPNDASADQTKTWSISEAVGSVSIPSLPRRAQTDKEHRRSRHLSINPPVSANGTLKRMSGMFGRNKDSSGAIRSSEMYNSLPHVPTVNVEDL